MFCPKCGKEVAEGTGVCPVCGADLNAGAVPLGEPVAVPVEPQGVPVEPQGVPVGVPVGGEAAQAVPAYAQPVPAYAQPVPAAPKKPVNKKLIKLICIIAGAVVAAIVAIIVIVTLSSRVNAEKFVNEKPVFEGVSGYGSVDYDGFYDYKGLEEALGKSKLYSSSDELNELVEAFGGIGLSNYIDVDVDKSDELKNGDKVTVTIKVDYDGINKLKFQKKLVGDEVFTKEYTVSGLQEPVSFDPFEAVTSVSYDATSYGSSKITFKDDYSKDLGNGVSVKLVKEEYGSYLQLTKDGENVGTINFEVDDEKFESTKKVVIKTYNDADDFSFQGVILSVLEKEFDPDLIEYLTKADTISDEEFKKLKAEADKKFKENYGDCKYKDCYFGTSSDAADGNGLYFVYSYKGFSDGKSFGYVYYQDLKTDKSGKIINIDDLYSYSNGYYDSVKSIEESLRFDWDSLSKVTLKE